MMRGFVVILLSAFFFIASSLGRALGPHNSIYGTFNECSNEGEEVKVNLVAQNPCFRCICKSGHVKCDYAACPSMKGCHAIVFVRTPGACCDKCKGCFVNGTSMEHGETWKNAKDPCEVHMCQAGVLTKSRDICKPPCSNPVDIHGQCCPSCTGCAFEGKKYKNDQSFTSRHDPDLECLCAGGNITCVKRACPVLNCPTEYLYRIAGERCLQCKGQRRVYTLQESCYFARQVFDHGDVTMLDSCTSCVCERGTMSCERKQCPEIGCPPSDRIFTPGDCCPRCKQRPWCETEDKRYKHGERWKEQDCTDCVCDNGNKWCHATACPVIKSCPLGYKIARNKGECCEKCIKDEKACSVTGPRFDSFKTFDGLRYNMSSSTCKYTLLKDCRQNRMGVRIRYKNQTVSHVTVTFGANRVKLYRNFKIRMNRTRLTTKRVSKSGTLCVRISYPRIVVQDKKSGVRVIWDMNSGLKVKVDNRYRKSGWLCGLCGNFNGRKGDDFVNEKGKLLSKSEQMSTAWSSVKKCKLEKDNDGSERAI